jgi:hypothetical protein
MYQYQCADGTVDNYEWWGAVRIGVCAVLELLQWGRREAPLYLKHKVGVCTR